MRFISNRREVLTDAKMEVRRNGRIHGSNQKYQMITEVVLDICSYVYERMYGNMLVKCLDLKIEA